MNQDLQNIQDSIKESSLWQDVKNFLNLHYDFTKDISISVRDLLVIITVVFITTLILRLLFNVSSRKLSEDDKGKFKVVYGYFRWLIYLIILLITLHGVGVDVTAVLAASAALMIGVGLALQTLFKDIISGVFILIDQTVHAGDIIEIEGRIGKVEEIKVGISRAVTMANKVLLIPNHLYLHNSLYIGTQIDSITKESVDVGGAYGRHEQLV